MHRTIASRGTDDIEQKKYYHTGVGTEGSKIHKIFDGAFGSSLGEHIQSGYFWLAENYTLGDEIYLLGFSRGAFTVRSLAGMIGASGLLDLSQIGNNGNSDHEKYEEKWEAVKSAYKAYRKTNTSRYFEDFKQKYNKKFFNNGKAVEIQFLGVWDTVGAAGVPDDFELLDAILDCKSKWEFHSKSLGAHVQVGRHAMALDEMRSCFTVTRWSNLNDHSDAKEVWFPGVHSDVGGGYEDSALSDSALTWMIDEVTTSTNLKINNITSQLKPDPAGVIHNSYKGTFAALRSRPRNVPIIAAGNPDLHSSVLDRQLASPIQYPEYWPTRHLQPEASLTIDIYARERWNYTGLYLEENEEYVFEAFGTWVDKNDACDWKGTEKDENFSMGDLVRGLGSLWGKAEAIFKNKNKSTDFWGSKRVESEDWFSMIGAISNDGGVPDPVKNDGSPIPHTYVCLPDYKNSSNPLKVEASGYFYAFANDAWHFYANNKGSIQLEITRIT
jgi:hypothetical protein